MAEWFRLTKDKAVIANLSCGALILCALASMIFSNNSDRLGKWMAGIETDVYELKTAVETQAAEIKKLREALERERSIPAAPTDVKKAVDEKGRDAGTETP